MSDRTEEVITGRSEIVNARGYTRVIILLVAMCSLFLGIAIGAIVRGIAGAKSDDNRLSISTTAVNPDSLSAIFARVSAQVEPSVVHIKVTEGEERTVFAREGSGSGVIVNAGGFILTNAHVVKRASKIRVKLSTGTEYDAKVIGQDLGTDLAVVKIDVKEPLPVAKMGDSDGLKVGDWVLAIGSPFGLEQTVTAGIISAKDRDTDSGSTPFQKFLQTDAAINPGNSGGPLVNLAGEVVGINTQIATSTGTYNGIGFAMPSATAVDVYNQLVTNGRVRRGFLGIRPRELRPEVARLNKIEGTDGVLIEALTSETGPAARAGLQSGDVILSINGKNVKNVRELIRAIASSPVGSLANIVYVRNGEQHTAMVKLEERQAETDDRLDMRQLPFDPRHPRGTPDEDEDAPEKPRQRPVLGIKVKTLTPDIAKKEGIEGLRGAYVMEVQLGSAAEDNNVRVEDIITQINYVPVTSLEDFLRLTKDLKSGDDVVLRVMRKDQGPFRHAMIISFTMP